MVEKSYGLSVIVVCVRFVTLTEFNISLKVHLAANESHDARRPVFEGSDKVRHKPACLVTEDRQKLEISDLRRRGIVLSV